MSSRRSYEYRLDDIRLTLLSNQGVVQLIRQAFAFEFASITQPMSTFGAVPTTFPPGLVFDYGVTPFPEGEGTPVRFLHVEQTRVVIDVAGPSEAINPTLERLAEVLAGIQSSDGARAIGDSVRTRDYSEIRFRTRARVEAIVREDAVAVATDALAVPAEQVGAVLVPTVQLRLARPEEEYQGNAIPPYETWSLDLRAGTRPNERIFYSGAPLPSASHLRLLERIESLTDLLPC